MDSIFDFFLRVVTLPGKIGWTPFLRAISFVAGVGFLYLLTLREEEEGKAGDYIQRLINRIHKLRLKFLSRHLSILNSVASTLTRVCDRLFGPKLLSIQAIGVSVSLALFALDVYFLINRVRDRDPEWQNLLFDAALFLSFALFPAVVDAITQKQRGYKKRNNQSPNIWMQGWAITLLIVALNRYVSPIMCTDCLPPEWRQFFFSLMLMLMAIGIVTAFLFASFVFVTRLSLKKVSTASSVWKAIGHLLIGCIPAPVFAGLLKAMVFIITTTSYTSSASPTDPHPAYHLTARELFAMSTIVVYGSSFHANVLFVIAPAVFLVMAILLLANRLLWPVLERPLETLHRLGIAKHRKLIGLIGLILILFGVGKAEWLEKLWKLIT